MITFNTKLFKKREGKKEKEKKYTGRFCFCCSCFSEEARREFTFDKYVLPVDVIFGFSSFFVSFLLLFSFSFIGFFFVLFLLPRNSRPSSLIRAAGSSKYLAA
jgi:hypothetical protein